MEDASVVSVTTYEKDGFTVSILRRHRQLSARYAGGVDMSKKRDAKTPDPKPENLTPTPERKMGKRREREEKKGNGSFPILKQTRL